MKITILNGSPRKENTLAMAEAFVKGAQAALLLSAASPNPFAGAIGTYKGLLAFTGIEDAGIITAAGEENKSEKKMQEICEFASKL